MAYQLHRISVLVVEDNQPMLDITKSLLITFGVGHVIGAQNGEVGYKRFCEYNNDIVIADWMMRPMDGISFTRLVRNDSKSPNPYVPIILMTGFSERRRVLQARDTGVTEFLVKPFNARELYKRLVQVIERPRQFVRSTDFFGPDRRRSRNASYKKYEGPRRRDNDFHNPETLKDIQEQQRKAHEILQRIRDEEGLDKSDRFDINSDSSGSEKEKE
ncbi:MAG: response regulator [Alphaproteobacteria bacterium CG_4_9_14_3_um_filter_47_13]|nr:MAG: response regulator [Alphaproteobacteria bacterium CG_4_9_14_3_um_filter_47_13]